MGVRTGKILSHTCAQTNTHKIRDSYVSRAVPCFAIHSVTAGHPTHPRTHTNTPPPTLTLNKQRQGAHNFVPDDTNSPPSDGISMASPLKWNSAHTINYGSSPSHRIAPYLVRFGVFFILTFLFCECAVCVYVRLSTLRVLFICCLCLCLSNLGRVDADGARWRFTEWARAARMPSDKFTLSPRRQRVCVVDVRVASIFSCNSSSAKTVYAFMLMPLDVRALWNRSECAVRFALISALPLTVSLPKKPFALVRCPKRVHPDKSTHEQRNTWGTARFNAEI